MKTKAIITSFLFAIAASTAAQAAISTADSRQDDDKQKTVKVAKNLAKELKSNLAEGQAEQAAKVQRPVSEAVYLGLPSGTRWAPCNIGAASPNGFGGAFAYDSDIAQKEWGGEWSLPTKEQFKELRENCNCEWTEEDGVKGCRFTSKANGNSIFLPAAGSLGELGTQYDKNRKGAYMISDNDEQYFGVEWNSRPYFDMKGGSTKALSVRPVYTATGTAKATINGKEVDVKWIQLWKGGPKFAEYNVGATSATEYGGLYCWGGSIDKDPSRAYNKGTTGLSGDDDTATKLWGSKWRMPTQAELQSLLDNCEAEWTTVDGLQGRKFTGKGDYSSNSVFLPAAGCYYNGNALSGNYGYYWSSTPNVRNAYQLFFFSVISVMTARGHNFGQSVRAVVAE